MRCARVLVVGGFGNFGARIGRALAADPAIGAGAHDVDLADGRPFVEGFPAARDGAARDANVLAYCGASSVPALSSAVVDAYIGRFRALHSIHTIIAPGPWRWSI